MRGRSWSCVALALANQYPNRDCQRGAIFFFNRFPRGHYLVWWVRVRVSLGVKVRVSVEVRVRVRVSNLFGSG